MDDIEKKHEQSVSMGQVVAAAEVRRLLRDHRQRRTPGPSSDEESQRQEPSPQKAAETAQDPVQ